MKFLKFFKKKEKKDLKEMSKSEKKQFLSNDFIDRMIRLEQRVSASLGEGKQYNKTDYYKGLQKSEKLNFNKYLRRKQKKKGWFSGILLLVLIGFLFLNIGFTGNVVRENIGVERVLFVSFLLVFLFLIGLSLFFIYFLFVSLEKRKFGKNFKILESIGLRREFYKYFD